MPVGVEESLQFARRLLEARGEQRDILFDELARLVDVPAGVLRESLSPERDEDYIAERIRLFEPGDLARNDDELLRLIQRIMDADGSQAQTDEWLRIIDANVPAPIGYVTDLIFYGDDDPRAEDVLAAARAHREVPMLVRERPESD